MVTEKASLALSRLTCQMPDYNEILEFAKAKRREILYEIFVQKFLSYIPIDYRNSNKIELFGNFTDKAFEFFRTRTIGERKIQIAKTTLLGNPAISILLLNDNKPFIVDSLSCLLDRLGIQARFILHPVISCLRQDDGTLKEILDHTKDSFAESLIYMKILGTFDQSMLESLENEINTTLDQVDSTYASWQALLDKVTFTAKTIEENQRYYEKASLPSNETVDFLNWLQRDNFTFLGSLEFELSSRKITKELGANSIWQGNKNEINDIINLSNSTIYQKNLIILGKINRISPVHRNNLIDYILIKAVDEDGHYKYGTIIFGLYSSAIYYQSIKDIPILRQKLLSVLEKSGFVSNGYNAKKLKIIIESLPREAIIQIDTADLYCMCLHMLSSMMSRKLKLFIQRDCSGSFVNVLIFLPRERLTPEVHNAINRYISKKLDSEILYDYITEVVQNFSQLFITLAVKDKNKDSFLLVGEIEKDLDRLSTNWSELFYQKLCEQFGEYKAGFNYKIFDPIFPADYRQKFNAEIAIEDINYLKEASSHGKVIFNLVITNNIDFQLKIYNSGAKLALSEILPFIENLGFIAIDEQSFAIKASGEIKNSWIYYFNLFVHTPIEEDEHLKVNVEEALDKMATGLLANDSLSKLIVKSGLNWRQVKLLKALTRYLHQSGFSYGKGYVQLTLIKHHKYTKLLVALFDAKFNPADHSIEKVQGLTLEINNYLDTITSSSEDKVLRHMFKLIEAMVRTNCYQSSIQTSKDYLSFKFDSSKVPDLPRPIPYAEIYVYSNNFEGIHLRGGKVARGGIRWSDRGEDYRIEVLGLMKAQMTKNAVIVPVGSKGGFFVLAKSDGLSQEEYMAKVIDCYKDFLRGLLDLTDNIIDGKIVQPQNTIIYDSPDPYLVVAADKGTATFSDYANQVSAEYSFWLGDAFASGGSSGYDHKKMSITAKGAWISVRNHFQEMGIDVETDPITVVGIGDMSGDVFGNGMLRSRAIKLVAAFNHQHIFIDPNPDLNLSFDERARLFALPRSKWSDYNPKLISSGGGVSERSAKLISLSSVIKDLLQVEANELSPEDLIRAILKAKVDLIWNGGIGTYIKASTENNFEIGDKTNDLLRCDAKDIRAKVIAEGGNLGVSQQGRIEYNRNGGRINTDFIDNSGGVDCSDHEVNIKIALNQAVAKAKLSLDERNQLLANMSSQVENLVLADNYKQTQAITIAQLSPALTVEAYSQFINILEEDKLLDRTVEFLPSEAELHKRALAKERMTRPELAVLLSYSKMSIYNELAASNLTNDKYFESYLINYFPSLMQERFSQEIFLHPLREEIIRTVLTNKIINQLGGALLSNIKRETGRGLCDIVRSYTIISEIFNLDSLWDMVEALPATIDHNIKIDMFTELAKIMRRGISWFVKYNDHQIDIIQIIDEFKNPARHLSTIIGTLLLGETKLKFDNKIKQYKLAGINEDLANRIATLDNLVSVFDIIYIAKQTNVQDTNIASLYFYTANKFSIDWLRKSCEKQMDDTYWNRLSIQSLKDDLYDKQRRLLISILCQSQASLDIASWINDNQDYANIYLDFIEDIKLQENINLNIIILANKKFELFLRKLS